jgi:oxygen-independent coproporphyrinogen-3 oxidase
VSVSKTVYSEMLPRHLYVHVPFCGRRCVYCDFSIAVRREVPVDEFAAAVGSELAIRQLSAAPIELDTLYLGGGTPSRLGGDGVAQLIDMIRDAVALAPDAEVTIEANPDDVTPAAAARWRAAGVNRLSLGAQSFDDAVLIWMHRTHDAEAIRRAVDAARRAGIDNLSLDLIFALPQQFERSWEADLSRALELSPEHVSLYGLTIEPQTPLGRAHRRGQVVDAPDERYEREFLEAHDMLGAAGFEHYEVSNYGLASRHSRHNSAYWSGAAYLGVGPSAHGFDGEIRRWNRTAYADWLRALSARSDPIQGDETLTTDNRSAEAVYLGLRTSRGVVLEESELAHVAPWIDAGWAVIDGSRRLVLTPRGWLRLDALSADLTAFRSRY